VSNIPGQGLNKATTLIEREFKRTDYKKKFGTPSAMTVILSKPPEDRSRSDKKAIKRRRSSSSKRRKQFYPRNLGETGSAIDLPNLDQSEPDIT
jgi:hypothetical protein